MDCYAYKIALVKESPKKYPIGENLTMSETVAEIAQSYIGAIDREQCIVIALNTKNDIIGVNTVSIGALDSSIVHPREVYKFAILVNASSIIIAHNHPSGNIETSDADIVLTKRLAEAGKILGIELLDHVIIGGDKQYNSLKSTGLF